MISDIVIHRLIVCVLTSNHLPTVHIICSSVPVRLLKRQVSTVNCQALNLLTEILILGQAELIIA